MIRRSGDVVAGTRPAGGSSASTSMTVTWPAPVPRWDGRDQLTLALLAAVMLVPALLIGLAAGSEATAWGNRLLIALPLVIVLGLVTVSPLIRDPEPRHLAILPWGVWAGAAFVILAVAQVLLLSVSPERIPAPTAVDPERSVEILVVDPDPAMALIGVVVAVAITVTGILVGSVARRWGRRWLVLASPGTVCIVPIWLVVQFLRDPALMIAFGPEPSPGAEIASAVALVCLLLAPTLALIAGAQRRVGRTAS